MSSLTLICPKPRNLHQICETTHFFASFPHNEYVFCFRIFSPKINTIKTFQSLSESPSSGWQEFCFKVSSIQLNFSHPFKRCKKQRLSQEEAPTLHLSRWSLGWVLLFSPAEETKREQHQTYAGIYQLMHFCTWSNVTPPIVLPVYWNLYSLIYLSLKVLFLIRLSSNLNFKSLLQPLTVSHPSKALKSTNPPLPKQTLFHIFTLPPHFLFPEASILKCTSKSHFPSQPTRKSSWGLNPCFFIPWEEFLFSCATSTGFSLLVPELY